MISSETTLHDALHCASKDETRGDPNQQRFARGIIVGMLSMGMAFGVAHRVLVTMLRSCMPLDVDPECLPVNFEINYKPGRFRVVEHANGFELVDSRTGAKHWLSDGVDCVSAGIESGDCLSPGDPGFAEIWEQDFNDNEEETLAAYWPEEDESETETP